MEGGAVRYNFERGLSKDSSSQAWSKLAQWYQRRCPKWIFL